MIIDGNGTWEWKATSPFSVEGRATYDGDNNFFNISLTLAPEYWIVNIVHANGDVVARWPFFNTLKEAVNASYDVVAEHVEVYSKDDVVALSEELDAILNIKQ